MISQFLDLPDLAYISEERKFQPFELGYAIQFYEEDIYDFSEIDIAILGVRESRAAAMKNLGCDIAPDEIRKHLFRLHKGESFPKILDLGNILDAETVAETYDHLEQVLSYIYKNGLTVIILGGSQDLTYPQYFSFESLQQELNVVIVDERLDLIQGQEGVTSDGFIQHLMTCPQPQLGHLTLFGYQTFFVHQNFLNTLSSMGYETVKLGSTRYQINQYQHIFRMSDIVSLDISSVKQSDAPGRSLQSPNGFLSDEFCQIARYAGMSDKVKSIGFYEVNPQQDIRNMTTQLTAQAIWFFMEGYSYRSDEYPGHESEQSNYAIFMVEMPEFDHKPFHFWNSQVSQQWWVEFPLEDPAVERFYPCSRLDYEQCARGELTNWLFNLTAKVM